MSYHSNHNNDKYGTKGGNNTEDNVFLLSIEEAEMYFSSDNYQYNLYPIADRIFADFEDFECHELFFNDKIFVFENMEISRVENGFSIDIESENIIISKNEFSLGGVKYSFAESDYLLWRGLIGLGARAVGYNRFDREIVTRNTLDYIFKWLNCYCYIALWTTHTLRAGRKSSRNADHQSQRYLTKYSYHTYIYKYACKYTNFEHMV